MQLIFVFSCVILCFLHCSQPGVVHRKPDDVKLVGENLYPETRGMQLTLNGVETKIWPFGNVRYRFHSNVGTLVKTAVLLAMDTIQNATSDVVKFLLDETSERGVVVIYDYEYPQPNGQTYKGSCYAMVGYHENKTQALVLTFGKDKSRSCDSGRNAVGASIHEVMHVLGFTHEFQRHDRDHYILLNETKIKAAYGISQAVYDLNFGLEDDETKELPFDYTSIMQYNLNKYIDDKPNRTAKVVGVKSDAGRLCGLSAGDRNLIERTYYKESRGPQASLVTYTDLFEIPGETCRDRLKVMSDEME